MRPPPVPSNFAALDLNAMPSLAQGRVRAHRVPLLVATDRSLRGYGRLVADFATAAVTIVTWPQPGWRPIVAGTGNEGGIVEDSFVMERRGEVQHAVNRAVGRSYITGWFADPAVASEAREPADLSRIYTHEANYHPDGGQVFSPRDGAPFVALLAKPGDDVRPEDFAAFYCNGEFGIHIDPGVWHQPVFPLAPTARFDDKQGRVHACIAVDFVSEFGCYLEVPLSPAAADIAYKVLTPEDLAALSAGAFGGAPVDRADGFIHLSTAAQLNGTLQRHFAGRTDLTIAAVDLKALGQAVRWEPSRGGQLFPHVYGALDPQAIVAMRALEWDASGAVRLPLPTSG
jgi:ureidoglycolate lyase/seryl-tRNA synthetase